MFVGTAAFQWFEQNQQAISDVFFTYVAPAAAAIILFFLLRFLWACGGRSVAGFVRYLFNLLLLLVISVFFWPAVYAFAISLIEIWVPGFQSPGWLRPIVLLPLCILSTLYLTSKLARKFSGHGLAWDLLRGRRSAVRRQLENRLLPLLHHPGEGWLSAEDWNRPYVRGFFNEQLANMLTALRPKLTASDARNSILNEALNGLLRRSGFSSQDYAKIKPITELKEHPEFRQGTLDALIFLEYYHDIPFWPSRFSKDWLEGARERYEKFVAETPKPKRLRRRHAARRALVEQYWRPKLSAMR
ncbi:hypothetical protein [Roseovarius sp.]|uniref:hypothetical protein n=1 Tax=Roseovarius sp. TaxID=1486281 RepID=UPI00356B1C0A